jgi:hypothetical protein
LSPSQDSRFCEARHSKTSALRDRNRPLA